MACVAQGNAMSACVAGERNERRKSGSVERLRATIVRMRMETEDGASAPVDPEQVLAKPVRPPLEARP